MVIEESLNVNMKSIKKLIENKTDNCRDREANHLGPLNDEFRKVRLEDSNQHTHCGLPLLDMGNFKFTRIGCGFRSTTT